MNWILYGNVITTMINGVISGMRRIISGLSFFLLEKFRIFPLEKLMPLSKRVFKVF